jgi:urease accessory protein
MQADEKGPLQVALGSREGWLDMSHSTLLRLMTLLSPSFPVGGFAYSHGLEQAAADGWVANADGLSHWISQLLHTGSAWNDAVLLAEAHRSAVMPEALRSVAELAEALAGSRERHMESQNLGAAFITAVASGGLAIPAALGGAAAYPVAVGAAAAAQGLGRAETVSAFLHAFASNQIQCAIRLGILGQAGGVRLLAALEAEIADIAARAAASSLEDLGSNTIAAEIASMRHETLYSRIFRT